MTLEELDGTLPNGFHDAEFYRIDIDYRRRRVMFEAALWVGTEQDPERREEGVLLVEGLAFISLDQPEPSSAFMERDYLWVDHGPAREKLTEQLIPDGHFASEFYVTEWNAFIVVVARGARWEPAGVWSTR